MILLNTRRTKEKLEQYLELSNKKANDAFEDMDRLEGRVRNSMKRNTKTGRTEIMIRQSHNRPLQS